MVKIVNCTDVVLSTTEDAYVLLYVLTFTHL